MKLKLRNADLGVAYHFVSQATSMPTTLPVLAMIHCSAREHLEWRATNLDMTLVARCPAVIEGEGAALIPARVLRDCVRHERDCELETDGQSLTLRDSVGVLKLGLMDVAEFPRLVEIADGNTISFLSGPFLAALRSVANCCSQDESRYVLMGVSVEFKDGSLRLTATDGRRISTIGLSAVWEGGAGWWQIILRQDMVQALLHWLGGNAEKVTLQQAAGQVWISAGNFAVGGNLIDGNYPNYRQVIPDEKAVVAEAVLHAADFKAAVQFVSQAADERANAIKVVLHDHNLRLSAGPEVRSTSATVNLPVVYSGPELRAAFNHRYLTELAEQFGGEPLLTLGLIAELEPLRAKNEAGLLSVVMPMSVH